MKLRKIEFEGIRAFADKTTFNFGRSAGLYFLQGGDNAQDPELGSNGVGKSTVWAILCWVLFGKTADGLRAGDLKSWQSKKKGYWVKLYIGRSIIERSWSPNKLTLDGEIVEQAVLEDFIGINFETFITTILVSQGEPMFFDLSAVKKLSIFTSLLRLDAWMDYSDKAKDIVFDISELIGKKEIGISRLEGQLDGLDIETLQEKRDNFKSERYNQMTTLQSELLGLKELFKPMRKRVRKAKLYKKELERKRLAINSDMFSIKDDLAQARKVKMNPQTSYLLGKSRKVDLQKRIKHVQKHKGQECDMCGQTISAAMGRKQMDKLKRDIFKLDIKTVVFKAEVDRLDRRIKTLDNRLDRKDQDLRKIEAARRKFDREYDTLMEDYSNAEMAIKILEQKVKVIYDQTNPFSAMLSDRKDQEKTLLKRLTNRRRAKATAAAGKDLIEYWVQGFKDVRLYLIHEALEQLETETNKALAELGFGTDWQINYAIDRTSKAGRSVAGFNVLVKSPYNKKQVPFAAWSGGEKQRLKIAGTMGFMSLVSARTGLDLSLEVYDEPTQHLSPQGIDSLLEALRVRALQEGKRIWLVDHHTLDYGGFTSTAVVSKAEDGRSTVWQS